MDTEALLSRLPFVGAPAADIIFPGFTLALASYLVVLQGLGLVSRNEAFGALYGLWVRILAVGFGAGAVVCLLMPHPLGSAEPATPVLWLAAALVLQALLLGLMLAGWSRIGAAPHLAASLLMALLALGAAVRTFSADGRALLGAFLAAALVVGAASAWRLLKEPDEAASCVSLKMAIGMLVIAGPLQLVAGDLPGRELLSLTPTTLAGAAAPRPTLWFDLATIGLGLWGAFLSWRGAAARSRPFLWACLLLGLTALVMAAGAQFAAEAGRQPIGVSAAYAIALLAGAVLALRLVDQGPLSRTEPDVSWRLGWRLPGARVRPPASPAP